MNRYQIESEMPDIELQEILDRYGSPSNMPTKVRRDYDDLQFLRDEWQHRRECIL